MEIDERTRQSIAAYDEHAAAYQEAFRLKRPLADVRRFGDLATRGCLVLDAGCGPAIDLRVLADLGVHPVGLDLSMGALKHARMLLPRHPLVRAPLHDPPFQPGTFGGLWLSSAFTHLPRGQWREVFAALLATLDTGPVYFSCYRGTADMEPIDDPVLGGRGGRRPPRTRSRRCSSATASPTSRSRSAPTRSWTVAGRGWSRWVTDPGDRGRAATPLGPDRRPGVARRRRGAGGGGRGRVGRPRGARVGAAVRCWSRRRRVVVRHPQVVLDDLGVGQTIGWRRSRLLWSVVDAVALPPTPGPGDRLRVELAGRGAVQLDATRGLSRAQWQQLGEVLDELAAAGRVALARVDDGVAA